MSHEIDMGISDSYPAAADLSGGRYRGVVINSSGRIAVPAAGARCIGVLQDKPNGIDVYGKVMIMGVTKMEAGAPVAAGAPVTVDNTGRCVAALTTNYVLGFAKEAAGAAGVFIPVTITHSGNLP